GHTRAGAFYPDAVVTEMPVTPTGIYVQAGSFTVQDNAVALSGRLQPYARAGVYPTQIDGQQFYCVRLGPVETVEQADAILARLVADGNEQAIIMVE
ncbi:MAG: SPOR domain-containing protein, partial [Alphaproteobacteria bacterium]|nr:SPOR domain-containing protein [Alphaproteobacteria bacterium]